MARCALDGGAADVTSVLVPERVIERLARSGDVPFGLCPAGDALADGAVVMLASRRTGSLGLAVVDRTAGVWRVMSRVGEPFANVDGALVDGRLDAAMALRVDHGVVGPDRAFRLLNGAGDRVPGLVVDMFGAFAVVSALTEALVPLAHLTADRLVARNLVRGVVVKRRPRGQAAAGPAVAAVVGEAPPEQLIVSDGPWRFEVHLTTGVNVGLFADMRLERVRIGAVARGRRVLNLFAYTGTLSVAAAGGQAAHVTSVDLSAGVLAWARDNFTWNGLPADRHVTVADDAARYLAAAQARGDLFDLVLIDPPSFSAARHAGFAIDRDYAGLMAAACRVLAPGGDLWLATNTRGFSLVGAAQLALAQTGRTAQLVALGGLPPDFPTELADADARYLQTCLLRVA